MRIFVSSLNVPIGYTTPKFPSLFWPVGAGAHGYQRLFLYYSFDVWKFTVYWLMIFYGAFYLLAGLLASFNMRLGEPPNCPVSPQKRHTAQSLLARISVVGFYLFAGVIQGFLVGAVVGILLLAIYRAGLLSMSVWIPLCWAVALIFFNICTAYLTSSLLL